MNKICATYQEYMNIYPLNTVLETEYDALYSLLNVLDYSNYKDDIKKIYMSDCIQYSGTDFDRYDDLNQIWIWPDYLIKRREWKKLATEPPLSVITTYTLIISTEDGKKFQL